MPNMMFLLLAAVALTAGWELKRRAAAPEETPEPVEAVPVEDGERELGWDDVKQVDPIGLDVGYRLVPLVDKHRNGPLLGRIKAVRRKLSEQLGFLVHPVHIRDNLELRPNAYRISVLGVPAGEGEVQVDRELAINPGGVSAALSGIETTDPAFGLPAYWIEPAARDHAPLLGYTVADPSVVIATDLSQSLTAHAQQARRPEG